MYGKYCTMESSIKKRDEKKQELVFKCYNRKIEILEKIGF